MGTLRWVEVVLVSLSITTVRFAGSWGAVGIEEGALRWLQKGASWGNEMAWRRAPYGSEVLMKTNT